MRLLKAIGGMLVCVVLLCAAGAAMLVWVAFWYGYFEGEWRGLFVAMAPVIIWCVVSLTWQFYKEQG